MRARLLAPLLGLLLAALPIPAPPAAADPGVPAGWSLLARHQLAPGVEHLAMSVPSPAETVHVARVAPGAPVELRAVLSNDAVAGPGGRLERTSAMCQRVRCLAAVNGDFALAGADEPVGGMVVDGAIVRSPSPQHHQLVVAPGGRLSTGAFEVKGTLVPTDLRPLTFDRVNVPRGDDQLVVFLPSYGPTTATNPFGSELVFEVVEPQGAVRLGQTALVRLVELRVGAGDAPIPRNGGVLSGHGRGATALAELWARAEAGLVTRHALLRLEASVAVAESVGGTPILVRDGKRWFADEAVAFVRSRHPRTIVGWTSTGEVLLVTVDGRQPGYSDGMTLAEAADLMIALGAVEAINLDGGGSTTFATASGVANRPSDRVVRRAGRDQIVPVSGPGEVVVGHVERPVVSALALVAADGPGPGAFDPLTPGALELPQVVPLRSPAARDPGSNPGLALPALIGPATGAPPGVPIPLTPTLVTLAGVAFGAATAVAVRRRRR